MLPLAENDWATLSGHFNGLLRGPQGARDNQAIVGYGRLGTDGRSQQILLDTAVRYAQYVLATSLHR